MRILIFIFQQMILHQISASDFQIIAENQGINLKNNGTYLEVSRLTLDYLHKLNELNFEINEKASIDYNFNNYPLKKGLYRLTKKDDEIILYLHLNLKDLFHEIKSHIQLYKWNFTKTENDSIQALSKVMIAQKIIPSNIFSHAVHDCNGRLCQRCDFKDKACKIIAVEANVIDSEEMLFHIAIKSLTLKQIKYRIGSKEIYSEKYDPSIFCINQLIGAIESAYSNKDWLIWLQRHRLI